MPEQQPSCALFTLLFTTPLHSGIFESQTPEMSDTWKSSFDKSNASSPGSEGNDKYSD